MNDANDPAFFKDGSVLPSKGDPGDGSDSAGGGAGNGPRRSSSPALTGIAVALALVMVYLFGYPVLVIGLEEAGAWKSGNQIVMATVAPLAHLYERFPPYRTYIDWLSQSIDL